MQQAVLGTRWRLVHLACLLIVLTGGVFLSFSRGSWLAMILATVLMGVSTYVTADDSDHAQEGAPQPHSVSSARWRRRRRRRVDARLARYGDGPRKAPAGL